MPRTSPPFLLFVKGADIRKHRSLSYSPIIAYAQEKNNCSRKLAKSVHEFSVISRKKPIFPRPASALYSVFPAILRKPPAKPPFYGDFCPNFTIHTFSIYPTGIFPQCGYFGGQPLFFRKKSSRSLPQSKTCACNFFTYPLSFYNFSTQKTPFFHTVYSCFLPRFPI